MRSGVTAREKERAERATLVQQEKLSKAKVLRAASLKRLLQSRVITAAALQAPELPAWNELLSAQHHASLPFTSASALSRHGDMSAAYAMECDGTCVYTQGRVYALNDVWIRPPFGGKGRKMTGQLEAHANGFRYSSPKGEQLDIMYRCDLPAIHRLTLPLSWRRMPITFATSFKIEQLGAMHWCCSTSSQQDHYHWGCHSM